jgi:EmrB/QacA subfamily drug resistance transporter
MRPRFRPAREAAVHTRDTVMIPGDGLDRRTKIVGGVVVLGVIMSILDTTIVNVALESLSRDLQSPLSTIQWVVTGYLLALAMVIPLAGWMSERFGSKRVWMVSVALFAVGSMLCGVAPSDRWLLFFRVLQGFGGGMILPVSMTVLAQSAGPRHVGRVMSIIGVPTLLAPVLGPVIGGLIVDSVSWRWIFFVNLPVAALALPLAARLLPRDAGRDDAGPLDWRGFALLSPGLALIVFGLSEAETAGGIGAITIGPAIAGLLLVGLFAVHALRAARPLIDVALFRSRHFAAASVVTLTTGASLFGAMLIIPLYYQVDRGLSALDAGLLMAPQGIGAALAMPLAGRLTDRSGGGRVVLAGTIIVTLGTLPFVFVTAGTSHWLLAGALVVRGVGMGASMMPALAAAYSRLESVQVPRATSALNALQRVGGSIGTALLAVVLQQEVHAAAGAGANVFGASAPQGRGAAEPLAGAFGGTFGWAVAISALAIVPAALLALSERAGRAPLGAAAAGAAAG